MDWDYLATAYVQPMPISSYIHIYIYIMQYQYTNDIQWSLVYLSYCILWIIINPIADLQGPWTPASTVSWFSCSSLAPRTLVLQSFPTCPSEELSPQKRPFDELQRLQYAEGQCISPTVEMSGPFYVTCLMKICNITRFQHDFRDESSSAYGCGSKLGTLS